MALVKSIGRKDSNFGQLIEYIHQHKHDGVTHFHNIYDVEPGDFKSIKDVFMENDQFREERLGGVGQYHEIISFHPEDSIHLQGQPDILIDLGHRYLDQRAPNSLGFFKIHEDRGHWHLHMMISANEIGSCKSTRISKSEFERIKEDIQSYHQETYPELKESSVHTKLYDKRELHTKISEIVLRSKNGTNLLERLTQEGLETYTYQDRLTGLIIDGKKASFITLLRGNENAMIRFDRLVTELYAEQEKKSDEQKRMKEIEQVRNGTPNTKKIEYEVESNKEVNNEHIGIPSPYSIPSPYVEVVLSSDLESQYSEEEARRMKGLEQLRNKNKEEEKELVSEDIWIRQVLDNIDIAGLKQTFQIKQEGLEDKHAADIMADVQRYSNNFELEQHTEIAQKSDYEQEPTCIESESADVSSHSETDSESICNEQSSIETTSEEAARLNEINSIRDEAPPNERGQSISPDGDELRR